METTNTLKSVAKTTVNEVEVNFEYERVDGEMPEKISVRGMRVVQTNNGPKVAVVNAEYTVTSELLNLSCSGIELTDAAVLSAVIEGVSELVTNLQAEMTV
ncbi:MAG: hypothetical protein ACK5JD_07430 [Mangrovibacterium sp.]